MIDNVRDYSVGKRFRFAVVDLDKSKSYPSNFVCVLPTQMSDKGKSKSVFLQVFGDKSTEQARALLNKALETEEEPEVKAEIEKRLKLLEPEGVSQIKCSSCGKLFRPRRVRKYQHNFCEECLKKKFGDRV
jgi:formylmethanofuran dehydrogenase subunit E